MKILMWDLLLIFAKEVKCKYFISSDESIPRLC